MKPSTLLMVRPLFDHLPDVAMRMKSAAQIFLFLDFDGTLAPIVDDPVAASVADGIREQIVSLAESARYSLALISGRSVADLQRRIHVEGLIYAGNHGLEIHGGGLSFLHPAAAQSMRALETVSHDVETALRGISGTSIENKGLTSSVHYRKARKEDRDEIRRIVQQCIASEGELFQITQGLKVFEIRPRVNWNKGAAALWILESSGFPDALPVYLGDDATDEDAFGALSSGITIRIGSSGDSLAHYQLDSQASVAEFLSWIRELDSSVSQRLQVVEGELR